MQPPPPPPCSASSLIQFTVGKKRPCHQLLLPKSSTISFSILLVGQSTFPYSSPSSTVSIFSPSTLPTSNPTFLSPSPAPDPDVLTRVFSPMVENRLMPALVFLKSFVSVLDTCASTRRFFGRIPGAGADPREEEVEGVGQSDQHVKQQDDDGKIIRNP